MTALSYLMRLINLLNRVIGNAFMWLSVGIVLVCFWVVVQRYIFATSQIWARDLFIWMNGVMFTAVAGYALYRNDHVRVDIFYRPLSTVRKAWLDLLGVFIFLWPFCWVVWEYSFIFVERSVRIWEASTNVGGMPGFWLVKSFILVMAVLLALQGVAMAIRSILIIAGREDLVPDDYRYAYDTKDA